MDSRLVHGKISNEQSEFLPIPQLLRPDGDVSIMFLSGNGVMFYGAMDDDWYRATVLGRNITDRTNASSVISVYLAAEPASPLGCLEQWQWCNSGNSTDGGCGPLTSLFDSITGAAPLFNLAPDSLDANRPSSPTETGTRLIWPALMQTVGAFGIKTVISSLGAKSLSSQALLNDGLQLPLPMNQWQLDVENWFNTVLASIQAMFVNTALGTGDPVLQQAAITPLNDQERKLCNSQKIQSTAYASFSLFGLLFTYITSTLIILISFTLEPIFGYLQRRRKYKEYAHLEWTANATLQLHRLAQEELNCGTWEGCTDLVPTTDLGEMMASLDIEDLEHPKLVRPMVESEEVKGRQESGSSRNETSIWDASETAQTVIDGSDGSRDHVTNGSLTSEETHTTAQAFGQIEVHAPQEGHARDQDHRLMEDQTPNERLALESTHQNTKNVPAMTESQNPQLPTHVLADGSTRSAEPEVQNIMPPITNSKKVTSKT